ncbi:tRNA (adenosine(37)-N6)-threonylcarbamoyltransferase complex dimerization subunit type 1 TsaB [Aciduricibacillus chroicocephali]|uniref:tRNA (Adenosine(37)-N6)-threonylcarbamoyltransferase complex dimerization subunit type 1 TsaB n=1 Tax=Aciduricibacillus chroicocephali TaxID=3054939 RepID=A0ABY9KWB9_9BACI|nr:tRNA (adenosine(37)-N6)-threonylcarbamoyltransferase complex dimerization subunit type 1 TsaB [Bacillaceae bacterium 44XB]
MNILAMDTSNQTLGVALLRDGELIGSYITNVKKNHSVRLMPAVDDLMKEVGMEPEDLDQIVVANGPGSYTGVRIGVTTAKTLAWALNIPVKAVSSLELLAWQGRNSKHAICPFFDARRGLVFTGLYEFKDGKAQLVRPEQNILMEDWLHELKNEGRPVIFLSPELSIHRECIEAIMGDLAIIPNGANQYPNPADLAFCGLGKEGIQAGELVPNYLRLAEAEAKWLESNKDREGNE